MTDRERSTQVATRLRRRHARRRLRDTRFTLLSDDCWGGELYKHLGLEFTTPTIGTLIGPVDYLLFLRDPRRWAGEPLEWIERSRWYSPDDPPEGPLPFPIARLGGQVEVKFMHYASREEAESSWRRRAERAHWDRLLVKFAGDTKSYGCPPETLAAFDQLPYPRVCFTRQHDPSLRSAVHVPDWTDDVVAMHRITWRHFDVVAWLNGEGVRPRAQAPTLAARRA